MQLRKNIECVERQTELMERRKQRIQFEHHEQHKPCTADVHELREIKNILLNLSFTLDNFLKTQPPRPPHMPIQ
jgi:hypothetical protein